MVDDARNKLGPPATPPAAGAAASEDERFEDVLRQRDEARSWAWALRNRMVPRHLVESGEPAWLTSLVAPFETIYNAQLTRGEGTISGVTGLAVGDAVWVTNTTEPDQSEVVYAQVREVGSGLVRVQVLTAVTDAHAPPQTPGNDPDAARRALPTRTGP